MSRARLLRFMAAAGVCAAVLTSWPIEAAAQRRGRVAVRGGVVVAPRVFLGYGYYDPFWWGGWGPAWGPGWYGPYGPGYFGNGAGSARLRVTPKQAEVYVDGYLAGTVDDFDGVFQRLDVPPGEHELTLYLDGFETITQTLLFRPGATIDIRQQMRALANGESNGPRPTAATSPQSPGATDPAMGPGGPGGRRAPFPDAPPPPPDSAFGTLAVRVQPANATLLVDGEEWHAPEGGGPILIDLPEGPHEIEVRVEGRPPYQRTVQVRAGRTMPLNVSVSR